MVSLKNASALGNFYCSPINVPIKAFSGYDMKAMLLSEGESDVTSEGFLRQINTLFILIGCNDQRKCSLLCLPFLSLNAPLGTLEVNM